MPDKCECKYDDSFAFLALIGVVILLFSSCTDSCTSVSKENSERLDRIEKKIDALKTQQPEKQDD